MLDLLAHPEVTAGFRFMIAALAQGMAILTLHYAIKIEPQYDGHGLVLIGWAIESQAWAIHQAYYFVWWTILAANPDALEVWQQFRVVTTLALVIGAVGWVFVASPYLIQLAGRLWLVAGVVLSACLYIIGFGFAKWL